MPEENCPRVLLETSKGNITIELNREKAPITVKNFLGYVKDGFYDGLIFHRVIKDFMVQGGGFDADMQQKKPRFAIKNEAQNGLKTCAAPLPWPAPPWWTRQHHSFSSIPSITPSWTTRGSARKISATVFLATWWKGWMLLMRYVR